MIHLPHLTFKRGALRRPITPQEFKRGSDVLVETIRYRSLFVLSGGPEALREMGIIDRKDERYANVVMNESEGVPVQEADLAAVYRKCVYAPNIDYKPPFNKGIIVEVPLTTRETTMGICKPEMVHQNEMLNDMFSSQERIVSLWRSIRQNPNRRGFEEVEPGQLFFHQTAFLGMTVDHTHFTFDSVYAKPQVVAGLPKRMLPSVEDLTLVLKDQREMTILLVPLDLGMLRRNLRLGIPPTDEQVQRHIELLERRTFLGLRLTPSQDTIAVTPLFML